MTDAIRSAFPNLCAVLADRTLNKDIATALELSQDGEETLRAGLEDGAFDRTELMYLLAAPLHPGLASLDAYELESNISVVSDAVGLDKTREAFRKQLIINDRNTFEDVRYEIAVAAKLCPVLDAGTIEFERPIPDPNKPEKEWKNSDIFGTFFGQPVRVEVTVRHPELPPAIHLEFVKHVEEADLADGFRMKLRAAMDDLGEADQVRALVELLHHSHVKTGGSDVTIDGIFFKWEKGVYRCAQEFSHIEWIYFESAAEHESGRGVACDFTEKRREIIHPCISRSNISEEMRPLFQNPPGIIALLDPPKVPPEVTISTMLRQKLGRKLGQCEDGVINIVAYGIPLPFNDTDLEDGVLGVGYAGAERVRDEKGVPKMGPMRLMRYHKAPFAPETILTVDERAEFTDHFKKMSGVLHFRTGHYRKCKLMLNPNALQPVPADLALRLHEEEQRRGTAPESSGAETARGGEGSTTCGEDESNDMVWPEIAGELIGVCGGVDAAKKEILQLQSLGLSLEELRAKYGIGSEPADRQAEFVVPPNDDIAAELVIVSGGYEQAIFAVESYADEQTEGPDESSPSNSE